LPLRVDHHLWAQTAGTVRQATAEDCRSFGHPPALPGEITLRELRYRVESWGSA
jgi:hypothetical protein